MKIIFILHAEKIELTKFFVGPTPTNSYHMVQNIWLIRKYIWLYKNFVDFARSFDCFKQIQIIL